MKTIILKRNVPYRQFDNAADAFRDAIDGAQLVTWQDTDLLQGSVRVANEAKAKQNRRILKESIALLTVPIGSVYAAKSFINRDQKLAIELGGAGVKDIVAERAQIAKATTAIPLGEAALLPYVRVGGIRINDQEHTISVSLMPLKLSRPR